jgi:hypothetical protein
LIIFFMEWIVTASHCCPDVERPNRDN